MNLCLDIGRDFPTEFYRPFTIISLAAILGNAKQNERAKAWVSELGNIIMENRIEDSAKAKFILEHLNKVDVDQSFNSCREIQDTFGFKYSFEHGRRRLSRTGQVIVSVFTVIGSMATIVTLALLIYQHI